MINIFNTIGKVTSRIEPFHSEFLTSVLQNDSVFLSKFINLVFQSQSQNLINIFNNSNHLEIKSEDSFSDYKRIDLIIKEPSSRNIIGIEVKTTDSSVENNQLAEYKKRMLEKYPDYKVFLVFLTPFNKKNIPDEISTNQISAIREFDSFNNFHKESIHLNWDDITGLYDEKFLENQNVFAHHKEYIKNKVTNHSRLIARISNAKRNRGLTEFLGEESIEFFYEKLSECKINYFEDDAKIKFRINNDSNYIENLLSAFKLLLESEKLDKQSKKKDEVTDQLLLKYKNGNNGEFFKRFFSLIEMYSYLWLKGKENIGIRAAHELHQSSGVSIFTIDENNIVIQKNR